MVSTTHCSLRGASLQMAPSVGTVRRTYIPRTGEGRGSLQRPRSNFRDNWWSCSLDDLLQYTLMLKILSKIMKTNNFCLFMCDPDVAFSLSIIVKWFAYICLFSLLSWTRLKAWECAMTIFVPPALSQCLGQNVLSKSYWRNEWRK